MKVGIYLIVWADGMMYVGQSIHIDRRRSAHIQLFKANKHHNYRMQRRWNKYGNSFEFKILELCLVDELSEREAFYLSSFEPDKILNDLTALAGTRTIVHSEETKKKIQSNNPHRFEIVLKNGMSFVSQRAFAKALGYPNTGGITALIATGKSYDDIAIMRGLIEGTYVQNNANPITLINGLKFKSQREFSLACGYASVNSVAVAIARGKTYDEIASTRAEHLNKYIAEYNKRWRNES